MSVYIKGMEMPKGFADVRIYADGRVISRALLSFGEEIATAVPVPPHGRLIDAVALILTLKDEKGSYFGYESAVVGEHVDFAPVVIPASEEARR